MTVRELIQALLEESVDIDAEVVVDADSFPIGRVDADRDTTGGFVRIMTEGI